MHVADSTAEMLQSVLVRLAKATWSSNEPLELGLLQNKALNFIETGVRKRGCPAHSNNWGLFPAPEWVSAACLDQAGTERKAVYEAQLPRGAVTCSGAPCAGPWCPAKPAKSLPHQCLILKKNACDIVTGPPVDCF